MHPGRPRFWEKFRESNIRFRNKVTLGVGLTLLAAVLSGLNAGYNVREVERSVSFAASAASPLLIGAISLSESYQKLQSIFDPVMKNCAGLEGATRYLEQSQEHQRTRLDTLRRLAEAADADTELKRYEFSSNKIFRTRQALLDVCHQNTSAKTRISVSDHALKAATTQIALQASVNIVSLEQKVASRWAQSLAKGVSPARLRQINSELKFVETRRDWRHLRNFYKLKIGVTELFNLGAMLGDVNKLYDLQRLRKGYWVKVKALEENVNALQPYFEELGRLKDYDALLQLVDATKRVTHTGEHSLFNARAKLLENEKVKQALVQRLQREQGQYSVALLNIMDVAQRINRNAQLRAEEEANIASLEIAIGVIIGSILAILIGWYFRRAVTMPLEALSQNLSKIGLAMRSETSPVDERLLRRRDEIGDVAVQFAQTFQALAKARAELQEASRAELAVQRDRLHGAIENMPQGLYMLDRDGRIIVANRRLHELYNLDATVDLIGMNVDDFVGLCREKGAGVARTLSDRLLSDAGDDTSGYQTSQRVVELEDGRTMTMTMMRLPDSGYVVTHEDITEKEAAARQIEHMAMHDSLTSLANRTLFRTRLSEETGRATEERPTALFFLDLDRFKVVNDTLGHPVGDALLVEVADRLKACLDGNCFAARLGGDEFAIFQTGMAQPEGAKKLAEKLIRRISMPYEIDGHHIVIGTSIGIALAPRDGRDADELSKNADLALYCSKQEGRGRYRFFEADMDRRMRDWRQMEHDLREAIERQQFEIAYQPIVSLAGKSIIGFEALMRWRHPVRGYVSPSEFIPVAEEAGLISELGVWILEAACAEATAWPDDIRISVNISPVQFASGTLPSVIASALDKTGLDPERLILEITEGVFLNDSEQTLAALDEIRALGVKFALDDFGTGYSSLSYIRRFPFHKVKIDRSFIKGMSDDPQSLAIVKAVINLCHDLGIKSTAEGVETEAQMETLRLLGCSLAQGYLFGQPVPAAVTGTMLSDSLRLTA
jgi:diguanylate cyclase (GGDEF)-like protein